jgi:hypothetical protein
MFSPGSRIARRVIWPITHLTVRHGRSRSHHHHFHNIIIIIIVIITTTPSPNTQRHAPHLRVRQVELVVIDRGHLVVHVVVAEAAAEPFALRHSKLFENGVFVSDGDKNDDAQEGSDGDDNDLDEKVVVVVELLKSTNP